MLRFKITEMVDRIGIVNEKALSAKKEIDAIYWQLRAIELHQQQAALVKKLPKLHIKLKEETK